MVGNHGLGRLSFSHGLGAVHAVLCKLRDKREITAIFSDKSVILAELNSSKPRF